MLVWSRVWELARGRVGRPPARDLQPVSIVRNFCNQAALRADTTHTAAHSSARDTA
jgi:hypothetical protein